MSQSESTVGAVGMIRVAGLEITVTPLSQSEEMALDRALRKAAQEAAGDHFTRCKPLLDAMTAAQAHGDRLEAVREIVRMAGRVEPLSSTALWDYQNSAPGVALELYHRGRKATPGLTLAGLQAVVTEVNADEVSAALRELLRGADSKN